MQKKKANRSKRNAPKVQAIKPANTPPTTDDPVAAFYESAKSALSSGSMDPLDHPDAPPELVAELTRYRISVCDAGLGSRSVTELGTEAVERFTKIEKTLLAIAGKRVVRQNILHFATQLADHGKLFDLPVKLQPGAASQCHANAAQIWAAQMPGPLAALMQLWNGIGTCDIASGYALSPDGLWRVHSWLVTNDSLIETTVKRDRYFGVVLSPEEATWMWLRNCMVSMYPVPTKLLLPCDCDVCLGKFVRRVSEKPQPSEAGARVGFVEGTAGPMPL